MTGIMCQIFEKSQTGVAWSVSHEDSDWRQRQLERRGTKASTSAWAVWSKMGITFLAASARFGICSGILPKSLKLLGYFSPSIWVYLGARKKQTTHLLKMLQVGQICTGVPLRVRLGGLKLAKCFRLCTKPTVATSNLQNKHNQCRPINTSRRPGSSMFPTFALSGPAHDWGGGAKKNRFH